MQAQWYKNFSVRCVLSRFWPVRLCTVLVRYQGITLEVTAGLFIAAALLPRSVT